MYLLKPHAPEPGTGHHPEDAFINHHEGEQHTKPRNAVLQSVLNFQ
jgi:hypothetical protein